MRCTCEVCGKTYDDVDHFKICPHTPFYPNTVHLNPPQRKQKVRVVTTTGWWFDMDKPDDFNMFNFATSIRATGFLINDALYQPADKISSIFVYNEDSPPQLQTGVVIDFPGKPPA